MESDLNDKPNLTVNTESEGLRPRMSPNTPGKLKYGRTFLIGLAFTSSSIFWTYYNFMMPILLKEHFRYLGVLTGIDTLVGLIMVLDNIVAILLLPVFGALSDRTKSKFGKRTPYILLGCTSGIIAFSVIGLISHVRGIAPFIGLIAIVMWFNLSMAFYRSSSVSLMPDVTDPEVRSTGNAIINLMGAFAMVIGLSVSPIMGMLNDTRWIAGENAARAGGFYYVSIITAVVLAVLLLTVKETPTGKKFFEISKKSIAIDPITLQYLGEKSEKGKEPLLESLRTVFTSKEKSILYMLLVIFTWFFGYNAIDTFYSLYATNYLGWEEGTASTALMIAPITMILTAIIAGKFAEKIGRRKTIFIGLIGLTACCILILMVKQFVVIMLLFGVVGIFYGMININTIVIIWQMAPEGKIGAYTGAYYFFSQLSATLSPVVAGSAFDIYRVITGVADGQQYVILFPYVIFFEIVAMVFLSRVKRGETKKFTEQELQKIEEEYGQDD